MQNQFRVINRITKEEHVFNSEEIKRFFHCEYDKQTEKIKYNNEFKDYAISIVKPKKDILEAFIISLLGIIFVILTTKIIMQWINI